LLPTLYRTNYFNSHYYLHLVRERCVFKLDLLHIRVAHAALGAVSCKDVPLSLIFRNYCRRREDGRSENAPRRPFRTVVLAPGMQIIVRRGVCVCVRACVRGGETDPRMQIEPTSHGTPTANELAGLFADVDTYALVCAYTTHSSGGLSYLSTRTRQPLQS